MNEGSRSTRRENQLVLVLDGDVAAAEALALGLERQGRSVITCNDVESAHLIVERFLPSHIVADARISGPFGFEGLDIIRYARQHSPQSRVILMTGDAPEALQLEAAERGAVAFLRKPAKVAEVDSMIDLMSGSFPSPGRDGRKLIRMPLLDEILASEALNPLFQPVVALDGTWSHVGYEALTRFRSNTPLEDPEILFRYAARKERVVDLEIACMGRSLHAAARLRSVGPLFLNTHPHVFASGSRFRETIVSKAEEAGVPLGRIVLEITGQASMKDESQSLQTIAELQRLGVRFSFDDVVVTYNHLRLIDRIRPSFLKISQQFGTSFETDSTKMKIVINVLSIARDFSAELVLEGIETKSTAEAAQDLRIPLGEGYFFGVPADVSSFSPTRSQVPSQVPPSNSI